MKITSLSFAHETNIPPRFTCDGENINPALEFGDVPVETRSLALVVDDPDAPVAGGFVHWVLFNLDPKTNEIAENSAPATAVQGQGSSGKSKYVAPCPPSGTHRYFFKLYALDATLDLNSSARREDVEKAMKGRILAQAELIGLYKKQR